jgi:glutamine amidotransferase-like uncharacterized protein
MTFARYEEYRNQPAAVVAAAASHPLAKTFAQYQEDRNQPAVVVVVVVVAAAVALSCQHDLRSVSGI